jgi:methyl-accepting chemotaxis protein
MKKSVTAKFIVYIAVLLIVICGSLGLIANATSSNALINSIEQQLPAKAEDGARLVASRIDTRLKSIITLTKMPAMKSMDWSTQYAILEQVQESLEFTHMGVAAYNGHCTFTNGMTIDLADRDYFIRALAGQPCMSDPVVSRIDGSLIVAFAAYMIITTTYGECW